MTLKQTFDKFFLSRKCVSDKLQETENVRQISMKNAREEGYAVGKREGYEEAYRELRPKVRVTLEYGEVEEVGHAKFRPTTFADVEIDDAALAKKGDLLNDVRVRTALETLVRLVCQNELRVAKQTLVKSNVVKVNTTAETIYHEALQKLAYNSEYVEKCSNDFAEAVNHAKKVLSLDFKNGVAEGGSEPWSTDVPSKVVM